MSLKEEIAGAGVTDIETHCEQRRQQSITPDMSKTTMLALLLCRCCSHSYQCYASIVYTFAGELQLAQTSSSVDTCIEVP